MELFYLGATNCLGFPQNTLVTLEWHSNREYLFACAPDAYSIIILGPPGSDCSEQDAKIGLQINTTVRVGVGQFGMEFSKILNGLFIFEKGVWMFWKFNIRGPHILTCEFTSTNEHKAIKGRARRFRSNLISFSALKRAFLAASGGSNDSMIVHKKDLKRMGWKIEAFRQKDVCYGAAKCLKFNPKDDASMRVAMGGDSGYIHIWAIYTKTSPKMQVAVPDRHNEHVFYSKYNPMNLVLPSTSSGDEDEDGEGEVELEDVDYEEDDDDDGGGAGDNQRELEDVAEGSRSAAEAGSADGKGERDLEIVLQGMGGLAIGSDIQGVSQDVVESAAETFDGISNDAERIADLIRAKVPVSPEEVNALCQKILNSREKISKAIKGEDT